MMYRSCLNTVRPTTATRSSRYSTMSIRARPGLREIIRTPIFKSIFLTVVFGSAVVDVIHRRKNMETLVHTYAAKSDLLNEVITKLIRNEKFDLQRDLKMAYSLTQHNYNTVADVEIDKQVEEFLKLADSDVDDNTADMPDGSRSTSGEQKVKGHFI